jgi:hypothetical protein
VTDNLDWPPNFERTPERERTRNNSYDVSLSKAFTDLETELDRLGVDAHRYGFDARQRKRDQRPYSRANPDDPSFVLRWKMGGDQYAVACDRYSRLRDNVRTVGLYLHEKRKMEGRPVATGESEFANARLPPGDESREAVVVADGAAKPPHEVLDVAEDAPEDVVRAVARRLAANAHPDQGGDVEQYKRIQNAKEMMLS